MCKSCRTIPECSKRGRLPQTAQTCSHRAKITLSNKLSSLVSKRISLCRSPARFARFTAKFRSRHPSMAILRLCMSTATERQSLIPSQHDHSNCHDPPERQYALPRRKRTKYIYKSRSPSHKYEETLHIPKKRRQCVWRSVLTSRPEFSNSVRGVVYSGR
ncbi:uncharacterized protein K489DRAFT_252913 [Dissoconium aciculare CBS 342.82]|jgi:hypothetical protein|uniref:Uncharacterized protein n=1 Tax=Dissoconium aciculare CBS 342.82 TaxID=1314786 RepID=A0A6J3M405_9PEZI|nr:uncharacterized protein K489DRAFT_252913 [Dissoconium aciculare CBS 342.82]KAF1821652.1 hypothetical protein K489DRAFT_252913 [Dissoconium aciculare CBS 342.82]